MFKKNLLACVLCSLATFGHAATTAIDPAKKQLAAQLAAIDGSEQALQAGYQLAIDGVKKGFPPDTPLEFFEKIEKKIKNINVKDENIRMYAQAFSTEELQKSIEFFSTPTGQSIAKKVPSLTMQVGQYFNKNVELAVFQTLQDMGMIPPMQKPE